jgi:hypothetical protein
LTLYSATPKARAIFHQRFRRRSNFRKSICKFDFLWYNKQHRARLTDIVFGCCREGFSMNNSDIAKQDVFFIFSQGFRSFGFLGLKTTKDCDVQSV